MIFLMAISKVNCCLKLIDSHKRGEGKNEIEKVINDIESLDTKIDTLIEHEDVHLSNTAPSESTDMHQLLGKIDDLEKKIDKVIVYKDMILSPQAPSTDTETFQMMSKSECTKEMVGNRKVACGDLDKIKSCTCKEGKEYKKDDDYEEICKVDFCTCLDSSIVHLFGLHRNLLDCIII